MFDKIKGNSFTKALIIMLGVAFITSACSNKKSARKSSQKQTVEEPEVEQPPQVPQNPGSIDDIGVDVGEVDPDSGVTFGTDDEAKLVRLTVTASDEIKDYNHTSEFLLTVRSSKESCMTVKVRPGDGIDKELDEEDLRDAILAEQGEPCDGVGGGLPDNDEGGLPDLELPGEEAALAFHSNKLKGGLNLSATGEGENDTLCLRRTFRLDERPVGAAEGTPVLGGTVKDKGQYVTTGSLVAKSAGNKIKIWMDDQDPGDYCTAGVVNDRLLGPIAYGSSREVQQLKNKGDILYKAQVQRLANEAEKIMLDMEDSFGSFSDLDGNNAINIFISRQVGKLNFTKIYSPIVNNIQFQPVYRPGDLAPMNLTTNPSSNEGEVVYLWAPDPAAASDYFIYPSANSLNSNYAYGAVAYQLMTLIINNAKLIQNPNNIVEEEFLRESLGYLASIYYAGGAFSWREISNYLTGYTPLVSLTEQAKNEDFPKSAVFEGLSAQLGMRALFGWYLHNRICGTETLEPCNNIKKLINTSKTGKEAVASATGLSWENAFDHFGSSLPLGLLEDPATAYQTANAAKKDIPNMIEFKHFQEFNPTGTTNRFYEHDSDLLGLAANLNFATREVDAPAYFSPYPTLKHMPFRVLNPNSDIELRMKKDSLGFVLLTNVVSKKTDITSYIGAGLKVTALPIGDRDIDKRTVYTEVVSSGSSIDTRPIKLFSDTNSAVPVNQADFIWETVPSQFEDEDFVIRTDKEGWISGEVANVSINLDGTVTEIGDSDAYLIKIDPCGTNDQTGGGTASIAGCDTTKDYEVLLQLTVEPGKDQLEPVMAVTPQDIRAYHGAMIFPEVTKIDPDFEAPTTNVPVSHRICEANNDTDDNAAYDGPVSCQTNRMPTASSKCETSNNTNLAGKRECFPGEETGATFFSDTLMNKGASDLVANPFEYGYNFAFDNFLSMGVDYPFDTTDSIIFWQGEEANAGFRMFTQEEKNRMFYNFEFQDQLKPNRYKFHASRHGFRDRGDELNPPPPGNYIPGASVDDGWTKLTYEDVLELNSIRSAILTQGTYLDEAPVVESCGKFDIDQESCKNPCANAIAIVNSITIFLGADRTNAYAVCGAENVNDSCLAAKNLFSDFTSAEANSNCPNIIDGDNNDLGNFFKNAFGTNYQERFIWRVETDTQINTFYKPTEPYLADGSRCAGGPSNRDDSLSDTICAIFNHEPMGSSDLRHQFLVSADRARVGGNCAGLVYPDEFGLCADSYSYDQAVNPEEGFVDPPAYSCFDNEGGVTDQTRYMKGIINYRAGERVGLPQRTYPISFLVKGDRATVVPILVGGLKKSQGKYMIRARTFEKSSCANINPTP